MYRKDLLGEAKDEILKYISSIDVDREFTGEVIQSLIAHVKTLVAQGYIEKELGNKILSELNSLLKDPSPLFNIKAEDVHEAIEIYLKSKFGDDEGYIALGKSRNDHVSSALRLWIKKSIIKEIHELINLREVLVKKAEQYLDSVFILCTHLQSSQVSTFAHYLTYIEETLAIYTDLLFLALKFVDKSPLGSGAICSTMVHLDREALGKEAGFKDIIFNSIAATSNRDFIAIAGSINTCLSTFLSRIAEDIVILSTPQFNYIKLPATHLSTSSIMPHKKNPVTMEIARAWAAESIGHIVSILGILKGLPSGYNLDLQEANKHIIVIFKRTLETIKIFKDLFVNIEVNTESVLRDLNNYPVLATEIAEKICMVMGLPYRKVHSEIASIIRESKSIEDFYTRIKEKYDIEVSVNDCLRKPNLGSPNPEIIGKYIDSAKKKLSSDKSKLELISKA